MLRTVPDRLETRKMFKGAVKKLPFKIKYVPDRYKTKEICDKVIIENWNVRVCSWLIQVSKNEWYSCVKLVILIHWDLSQIAA